MIKKILLSLGLIGLGIINFSNAYMGKVNEFAENPYYTSVEVQAQAKGMGLTKKLGTIKNVFYTVENNGFFWGARGVPYMWTYRRNTYPYLRQGYLTKYSICDEITVDELTNCTLEDIDFDTTPSVFANFFDTVTSDDYYIYWGKSDGTSVACNFVCWSSHAAGKTLCFSLNESSNSGCPLGNTSSYLTGSLGISLENLQFDTIDNALLFDPPGWGSNGGNSNKQNYICPTFGQLLKQQNFNTGLCYNTTLRIKNGQLTTIPEKNIQETFTDYEEFRNYRTIYKNKCDRIQGITEDCENAFTGNIEKYIIIANAEETGINKKILWNNCNIALNYDLNGTTCTASGYIAEQPTARDLEERIINGNYTTINDIYVPTTGNILNRLLEDGETREEKANRDILGNFTQLVGKITSIFNARNGIEGIIPEYILWLIFVSLFLTVILKK